MDNTEPRQVHRLPRSRNTGRSTFYGLIHKGLALLLPFLLRTIVIRRFGAAYLGLNSLFSSVLTVLSLAELGFGSAIVYSLYRPIAEGDDETVCAYLGSFRRIYRAVGCVILAAGLAVMPLLPFLVKDRAVPGDLDLYLWYLIFLANSGVSYLLYGYKSAIPSALQRNDLLSKADCLILLLKAGAQLLCLFLSRSFYPYLLCTLLFTMLRNLLIARIVDRRYPQYRCRGRIGPEQAADLRQRVKGLVIGKLSKTSRHGIDNICISALLGLTMTAIYNNYFTVHIALVEISMILCRAMIPGAGNNIVTETREKNYADLRRFDYLYMRIAGWAATCLLCLCQPFMRLWMGEGLMLGMKEVIGLSLYFYVLKMGDMRWVWSEGAGLWWECRWAAILEALANIVLNLLFAKLWGVFGIILATLLTLFFINFLFCSRIVFKHYFRNGKWGEYLRDHAADGLCTLLLAAVSALCCLRLGADGIGGLLLRLAICTLVTGLGGLLLYRKSARRREAWAWLRNQAELLRQKS